MDLLELTKTLLKKYYKNINQIIKNSDNVYEDMLGEAYIVVHDFLPHILKNERVFINELKKKCLKFNKYGKRIESKDRWEQFNNYEEIYVDNYINKYDMTDIEKLFLYDIKKLIKEDDFNFLLYYYENGGKDTSKHYNISESLTRKKVSNLIKYIKIKIGE